MATTYLEALNRVLQLIGEEQVDQILETDSYTNLLSAFLNDIKEQIEDSHNWRALKKTYNVEVKIKLNSKEKGSIIIPFDNIEHFKRLNKKLNDNK